MVNLASSASSSTSPATSARSQALMKASTSSRWPLGADGVQLGLLRRLRHPLADGPAGALQGAVYGGGGGGAGVDGAGRTGGFVIRPRLQPDRSGHRVPEVVGVPPRRAVVGRQDPAWPARDQPQAGIRGDLVQPRAHRAPTLEAGQAPPGTEQRLLKRVLGV